MENKNYTKEDAYNTLNLINEWIRNSDTKTSILMAMVALLTGLSITVFDNIKNLINFSFSSVFNTILVILISLFICSFIATYYFSFSSLIARLKSKKINSESIFFFGYISSLSEEDFMERTSKISESEIIDDLKKQILINSEIAKIKLNYFNYGLKSSMVLLMCEIILLGIYIFQ